MATQSSAIERQFDENWQRSMAAIGVRMRFEPAQWPENLKAARAGRLQMWSVGSTANQPDGQPALERLYSPSIGLANFARFRLPAFDALYGRLLELPDGPGRAALFREAGKLAVAYMPYKVHVHRIYTDLAHPWITGWRQPLFRNELWQYVEVDPGLRARMAR
jgi:ABC-type transport system substrate-binding protein